MTFPKMNDLFPTVDVWNDWCEVYGISEMDPDIYTHIMIKYGGDCLRYSSHDMAAAKVFQILSIEYPAYIRKREAAEAIYLLELEAFKHGTLTVANQAANPNTTPSTDSLDPLPYIAAQQTVGTKLDDLEGLQRQYRATYTKYLDDLLKSLENLFQGILTESEDVYLYDGLY